MLESDPLRLRERSAVRLRERWFAIEPDRVFARAAAVCAKGAATEPPPPDRSAWALTKIDIAIDQLLEADAEAEESQAPVEEEDRFFPLLTDALLLDPERVREHAVAFNALDDLSRRAFFELCIEGKQVHEVIEAGPWDEDVLYRHIHLALGTFGYHLDEVEASEAEAADEEPDP